MDISRRSLLSSLTLTGFYANLKQANAAYPHAVNAISDLASEYRWTIARHKLPPATHHVDFWSRPLCEVPYANQLPLEVTRGALFFGANTDLQACPELDYVDSMLGQSRSKWLSNRQSSMSISNLAETLRSPTRRDDKRNFRTALLALDSRCFEPSAPQWADILPAFRGAYERLVGHFHIPHRGFHHWKQSLNATPSDALRFDHFYSQAAAHCDAVVFTSQSLLENDVHLPARASTGSLIGELMHRLSCVLLDTGAVAWLIPGNKIGEAKPARTFAIGTAGACREICRLGLADLVRQRELVFSSFGKPVLRPLVIGLGLDERCAENIRRQVTEETNAAFLNARRISQLNPQSENQGWLKFITLWPFDSNYGPWPD